MRKIFLLICGLMPCACGAHSLHIGDVEIPFHSTQYTTPSMHVQIGNEIVHAPAIPQNIPNSLHALKDNIVYSICNGQKIHVGYYWFIGACLVGADDNVYLESTGTQYIDTGISMPQGFVSDFKITLKEIPNNLQVVIGAHSKYSPYYRNFVSICPANLWCGKVTFFIGAYDDYCANIKLEKNATMYIRAGTATDACFVEKNGSMDMVCTQSHLQRSEANLYLFNINVPDSVQYHLAYPAFVKLFDMKIHTLTGELMRHMVPVPAGLQIGNYTVPENGMWDIVEQKFYGNSGTGEFIYGVDE